MAIPTRGEFVKTLREKHAYKGKADLPSIKAWLEEQGIGELSTEDGTPFTPDEAWNSTKALAFGGGDAPAANVKADPDPSEQAAFDARVKAGVDAALKAAGLHGGRAKQPDDKPAVKVKSSGEQRWESHCASQPGGSGKCFKNYDAAYAFAQNLRVSAGRLLGRPDVVEAGTKSLKQFCENKGHAYEEAGIQGAETKAYSTTSPTQGSALVPSLYVADLIKNVLMYGACRKLGRVVQMMEAEEIRPRHTGGLTPYYPAENAAVTESTGTYDNVTLNAKTIAVLTRASIQVLQDARPDIADEVADDCTRAVAQREDENYFIGNGTSTYAGVTGFTNLYGTTATDGGYVVVGGDTALLHLMSHINTLMGRLPSFAWGQAVWTCHSALAPVIFDRLGQTTPGGLTWREFEGLGWIRTFIGRPVVTNEVMGSTVDASGDRLDVLFGAFPRSAYIGDLQAMTIEASNERGFDSLSVYFRGYARHAFNVHSVGTATAAGPVVSFWQT